MYIHVYSWISTSYISTMVDYVFNRYHGLFKDKKQFPGLRNGEDLVEGDVGNYRRLRPPHRWPSIAGLIAIEIGTCT